MSVELPSFITINDIEKSVKKVSNHIENRYKKNHQYWKTFSEEEIWHQLITCILGSRVKHEISIACLNQLQTKDLLNPWKIIKWPKRYKKMIEGEMSKLIYLPFARDTAYKYPYPKVKSESIIKTALIIYKHENSTLKEILFECENEYTARIIIKKNCVGVGWKQASLFLRNVSYSNKLAILDTHVLYYMYLLNMIDNNKISISSESKYKNIENKLIQYANDLDISLSIIDIAIWIVMRVVKKEYKVCRL